MKKRGTPEGTERAFDYYFEMATKHAEAEARLDAISKLVDKGKNAGSSQHEMWPSFMAALLEAEKAGVREMRAFDAWRSAVKHMHDDIKVSEDDLRAVVKDSLADKVGELQFNLNAGLLGSKIAQAIRDIVIEHETGDIPLCQDHRN